jgi:hypothetical protein
MMADILMPYAETPAARAGLGAARLSTLDGRVIGIVNNSWRCMNVIADELTTVLCADFGVADVVERRISAAQTLPPDMLEAMAADCDAVAVATGSGAAELPRVVLPHPLNDRPEPEIRAALRERVGAIVEGLTC